MLKINVKLKTRHVKYIAIKITVQNSDALNIQLINHSIDHTIPFGKGKVTPALLQHFLSGPPGPTSALGKREPSGSPVRRAARLPISPYR